MINLRAHAKINLALEVMDSVDGYHLVNNIMMPIELHDEISIERDKDIYVVDDNIPDNIMLKAARLFMETFNINGGCKITINKKIPVSAGLAGGSTDAGAVLRGLNELYNVKASDKVLEELSGKLGSDVPFFIKEECALCTNRGEIINPLISNLEPIDLYLIKVNKGTSTKEVYMNYKYSGISKENELNKIIMGLFNNNSSEVINNIFNDLTDSALLVNDELSMVYNKLKENNINPRISGSGPTIFIVNPSADEIKKIDSLLPTDIIKIRTKTI